MNDTKTWESMSAIQRDSCIAQLMGWTEDVSNTSGLVWIHPDRGFGETLPAFTRTTDADYTVLEWARENLVPDLCNDLVEFNAHLKVIWQSRLRPNGCDPLACYHLLYRPGDYAHALYLTMKEREDA